jgi:hypothetical protein
MAFPATYNISYYEGDTYEFNIYPKNSDGSAFSLTNFSVAFKIATARGSGATQYECSASISNGAVLCKIPAAIGRDLTAGTTYVYDVQVTRSSDNTIYTLLTGNIEVTADVVGAV